MTQHRTTREANIKIYIAFLSILGLMACIAVLFPPVRQVLVNYLAAYLLHKPPTMLQFKTLQSYALGGIFFILLFDYCTLTASGKKLVQSVRQEIKDCLVEIDFRSLLKPALIMLGVYLLGTLTIIRSDYLYNDDVGRAIAGYRGWYNWSRYISEFASIFIHADTNLTDISPLPQLLSVLMLAISSVLLVYVTGNRKITVVRLLASIPLGLSPYFLECLSYKFDAPYMALSVLACIVPFLFVARKQAFLFCSVVCLLVMCMTYQAASGIYLLVVVLLCFQDWNSRRKSDKEILSFLWIAALAFCLAMGCFKLFFMKPTEFNYDGYGVSTNIHSISHLASGILFNIKNYAMIICHDFGLIWKICITLICVFFVVKSVSISSRNKRSSLLISVLIIGLLFIMSYGLYVLLTTFMNPPRTLFGFGAFLAVLCVYVVSDYKKPAIVPVLALSWCFCVFAFSFGNAQADQARYEEFRFGILLHDLSVLYPDCDGMSIQLKNEVDFAPSIKNISKHYPIIERLVYKRFGAGYWGYYYMNYFNYMQASLSANIPIFLHNDFTDLNLPVVLDSYYHTIQSDGAHILITLKH